MNRSTRPFKHWSIRARLIVLILLAALLAVVLAPTGVAYANAGPNASCVGIEASDISPPGSSDEFPGGMAALLETLRNLFPDVPPGQLLKIFAQLHEGSHEACDAAVQ